MTQTGYAGASLAALAVATLLQTGPAQAQTAAAPPLEQAAAEDTGQTAEEAIVVTGSRLSASGFTTPTPVTVIGEARIQAMASTNLGDALTKLPAFRATTAPTTALSSTGSGGNLGGRYLDLRGLGANRTLVLVEGRRFVPSSILGAVDTNLIPALLVKRVEIVTGGASAAYGSDAVAGVVNILLNKDLEGFRAQVQNGISQQGDAGSMQASLAAGTGFAGGRGRIVVAGEWSRDRPADDCYSRDWCRGEPQLYQNPNFRTNGQAANFFATNVHGSGWTPTGIVNGPTALRGTVFNPDGSVRATPFQYGQIPDGQNQIGGEGYGNNVRLGVPYLKIPVERYSLFANVEYDVTDTVHAFLTGSYGKSTSQNRGSALYERALTIQHDNPFLPESLRAQMVAGNIPSLTFGRNGAFDFGSEDIDPTNAHGKSQVIRVAAGLNGTLGGSWKWDAYYQFGDSKYRVDVFNVKRIANFNLALDAVAGPNGPICRSTIANPNNGCVPLNLFGTGNFSQAALDYSFGTPFGTQHIRQHVAAASVTGNLIDLWAGPLAVAAGVEYRRETTVAEGDPVSRTLGWQYGNGSQYSGRITTKEVFAEATLPLARDWAFAHMLDLNGAVRLTDYSTSGRVTTWKAGVIYEPIEQIRFRATRSRDIRAPGAQELYNPGNATPGSIVDRLTNLPVLARVQTGGNPALNPEVASTWTAGVVLSPGGSGILAPLRLSVDWYDISVKGAIAALSAQQIVDRCILAGATDLCGLITRDSGGLITLVRAAQLNLNQVIVRGVDAELDYRISLGSDAHLGLNVLGSYAKDLITIDSVGPIDRAGQTGQQYLGALGVPKWSVNATTTVQLGRFTATIENRYIPKGKYDPTLVGPEDDGFATTLPNSIATNRVKGAFYTNLGLSVLIDSGGERNVEVYGTINNLFDKDPPLSPGGIATNPSFFDTIGRYFQAGVRVRY